MNLGVDLAPCNRRGLKLANPVMTASGTCGYGTEKDYPFDIQQLGAFICKGTTLKIKEGNTQPRIAETSGGMLNSIGLQNIGAEALIEQKAPVWAQWKLPVIVNIAGETIDDYARLAYMLDDVSGVSALEVNISCPNVKAGGAEFGADAATAARVTAAVRGETSLPLMVKLTPNTADIKKVAQAVAAAGADCISLINTLKAMTIDIKRRKPLLGNVTGGLSGPAVKPVALAMLYEVAAVVDVPLVGCGGITTAEDAIEFLMAGASAVQVGTATLVNPRAPLDVLAGIESFMSENSIDDITELIGAARK